MNKSFVKIDAITLRNLEKIAKDSGFASVEDLLTEFEKNFSAGCSVTLPIGDFMVKRSVA